MIRCGELFRAKAAEPLPVRDQDIPFFTADNLHDSWVISTTRELDSFTLTIDSVWDHDFLLDLGVHLSRDFEMLSLPIDLEFSGVTCVRWMRHDKRGSLRFFNPKFSGSNKDRRGQDTYHYSWFEQEDGRIQWLAMFHCWQPTQHRGFDSPLYLGVDCQRATAVDRRLATIKKTLGPEIAEIWTRYRQDRDLVFLDREEFCTYLDSHIKPPTQD